MTSPLQQLRELFHELMKWEGEELMPVDFVMASYLSGFLPGSVEKAWGDLCGPPAIGKTEILKALEDGGKRTIMIDHLTENSFSSAMRDPDQPDMDFSLLYQLSNKREPKGPKVLVIKEFSTIMNMAKDKANKIFSDLRSAYDNSHNTAAGNVGVIVRDDLHFGLLTACTEKLDEHRKHNQTLGERTLVCRIGLETRSYAARQEIADHVVEGDRLKKAALQAKIKITTRRAIDAAIAHVRKVNGRVRGGNEFSHRVGRLAAIATSIRTSPLSDRSYANLSESPARFSGQLISWGDARVLFDLRQSWIEEDYSLVRRVAQDTMPPESIRALSALWRGSEEASIKPLTSVEVIRAAMVDPSFSRQLQQWAIIGILLEYEAGVYGLNPEFAKDVSYTSFLEGLS
jgi:hypothetical protein